MILGELGLLHTDVGNYRIALGYLLERDKLPYSDNAEGLDVLLSKAQALLHVGREADAADGGRRGARDDRAQPRARAVPLARARLGRAGQPRRGALRARARALRRGGPAPRRLAQPRSPSAIASWRAWRGRRPRSEPTTPARALVDLDYVEARLARPEDGRRRSSGRTRPRSTWRAPTDSSRAVCGASANRELGRLDAEAQAILARRTILEERLGETNRVEIEREEMLDGGAARAEREPAPRRARPPRTGCAARLRGGTTFAPAQTA